MNTATTAQAPEARSADSTATATAPDAFAVRGFLLAHVAMTAALVVIQLVNDGTDQWPAIPLGLATVAIGLRAARDERRGSDVAEWVWFAFAGLWLGLVLVDPQFLQAMFTLFPVTYAVVRWPHAIVASALMPVVWGIVIYGYDEAWWEWTLLPAGVWILSCCLGYWILRVIDQSVERAALIAELEATRAELADAQRAEGARAERDRMARDIHDTLAQGFSSIVLHARGALARGDAEHSARTLELVEQVASEHLGEARRLVATATRGGLVDRTLIEALRRVADADVPRANLHVDGEVRRLSGAIEIAMLRITQEAVANARKHAGAGRIDITLSYTDADVLLDVVDDGAGFEVAAADSAPPTDDRGFGLAGARARAAELGGELVIESTPGGGTSISVALPTENAR